ncbi:MAG: hypothetical protein IJZ77_00600 [Bacilli bacterium]|nr:hypothetical protein [Bacilli bacterium]
MFKELVKLSLIDRFAESGAGMSSDVHLIVIVTKDGRIDETFESIKDNITIPYITVNYDEIIEYLNDLVFHKMIYDKIISENLMDKIDDEQLNETLSFLHLDNFEKSSLQEVIVFDDAAYKAILTSPKSQIISMIHEARHYKFIFCFCVQGIKAIPLPIKEQMTTLFLFSGFINQKLPTIYQQSGITSIEYNDFKKLYHKLDEKDYILVDCRNGTFKVVNGSLRYCE